MSNFHMQCIDCNMCTHTMHSAGGLIAILYFCNSKLPLFFRSGTACEAVPELGRDLKE